MNKKQYNNIIDWTLKHENSEQTNDCVGTARAIFNNMAVALPQGNCAEIADTLKSDDYMGWKSCTREEAQEAANRGTAAIAVSDDELIIVAAEDKEEPITDAASVMTLSNIANTSANMRYYTYSNTTTNGNSEEALILDKPYDPSYPYANNYADGEIYYNHLSTYSYELRNEVVYKFNFDEFNKFRAHLALLHYQRSSTKQAKSLLEDIKNIVLDAASYIPKIGIIFGLVNTASTISSIGKDSVQENLADIKDAVDAFSYYIGSENKIWKRSSYIDYTVSLLKKDPNNGREIKIESTVEKPEIYTLQNAAYDSAQLVASIYAHDIKIYKVAPYYTYFDES